MSWIGAMNNIRHLAEELPRESAPCNATNEAIIIVESFIGDILTEVQNGLGYADARAKSLM